MNSRAESASAAGFVLDLGHFPAGAVTTIIGYVVGVRRFSARGLTSLRVRDITGVALVEISDEFLDGRPAKGTRIKVTGRVTRNSSGDPLLRATSALIVVGRPGSSLASLEGVMREYAGSMLLSRVCRHASEWLSKENFVEFDSRVISTSWPDNGLEPLLVLYPGFGSPVALATSPASQVLDFMEVTGVTRAFTVSKSFTTTYRFADGGTEERVIVARLTDADADDLPGIAWDLTESILGQLVPAKASANEAAGATTLLVRSPTEKACDSSWDNDMTPLVQVQNARNGPLVEGSLESVGATLKVATIVVYPTQFLEVVKRSPMRNLRDLAKSNGWLE